MPHTKPQTRSSANRRIALRDIVRRLDALERRVADVDRVGRTRSTASLSQMARRFDIIKEDQLRRDVAHDETLRKEKPDLWRSLEADRSRRNRERVALNEQLRAAGCKPMSPVPSLNQRVKTLRKLQAHNRAETATPAKRR